MEEFAWGLAADWARVAKDNAEAPRPKTGGSRLCNCCIMYTTDCQKNVVMDDKKNEQQKSDQQDDDGGEAKDAHPDRYAETHCAMTHFCTNCHVPCFSEEQRSNSRTMAGDRFARGEMRVLTQARGAERARERIRADPAAFEADVLALLEPAVEATFGVPPRYVPEPLPEMDNRREPPRRVHATARLQVAPNGPTAYHRGKPFDSASHRRRRRRKQASPRYSFEIRRDKEEEEKKKLRSSSSSSGESSSGVNERGAQQRAGGSSSGT